MAKDKEIMPNSVEYDKTITINGEPFHFKQETISAEEYIDFLKKSDLGQQYPKEDFVNRINTLVKNVQISLVVRNAENKIIGVCFGLTDFAYWLLLTDLGVDRAYGRKGIGKILGNRARTRGRGEEYRPVRLCQRQGDSVLRKTGDEKIGRCNGEGEH
jgi:predicted N-acetyltransferase YhbS